MATLWIESVYNEDFPSLAVLVKLRGQEEKSL